MKWLQAIAALFVVMVPLAPIASSASAAELEGPFFQVNKLIIQHGCTKVAAGMLGNFASLGDCIDFRRFRRLGALNGWIQGCELVTAGAWYRTEPNCLDKSGGGRFVHGWKPLILFFPLANGDTRLLLASVKEKFELKSTAVGITVLCKGLKLPEAGQMEIQGVAAGNGGISKEVIEFTTCSVEGNGEGCEVVGENVKTEPVFNLLGYSNAERAGYVLELFEPQSGKKFVKLTFTPTLKCTFTETPVEGTVVGVAQSNGSPVEIGAEAEQTLHGEVAFPHANLLFLERGGALIHVKAGLKAFGVASSLKGSALIQVDEGTGPVEWGIYT